MRPKRTHLWLKNSQKPESQQRLAQVTQQITNYHGRCFFVINENGELCPEPATRNHTIPQSEVLDGLKDRTSGKVLEFRWTPMQWADLFVRTNKDRHIDLYDPNTFDPHPIGTGEATIGYFACKVHDQEFASHGIDVAKPAYGDPTVCFLTAYRSTLYALYLGELGMSLIKTWDQPIMRTRNKRQRAEWGNNHLPSGRWISRF